jgi:tetratricopeptide (TPR) repeat protein
MAAAQEGAPAATPPEAAAGGEPGEPGEPTPPPKPAAGSGKDGRRPYTAAEFEMENMSEMELEAYGKISQIREDSIVKMKDLIEKNPNYGNIADVCYRIAEFTTENIKYRLTLQVRQYRKEMERFKSGELKEEPVPPLKDYSATLPYYERIVVEHPQYPRAEEVLFYLGRNGVETGKALGDDKLVEGSIRVLNKLEEHFPQSQFLPKAFLMSGEYYFAKSNLFEALKYYKKLVDNYKDAPMYLYALYKLGWTYYNYQQHDKTLVCFEEVIQKLREAGKGDDTLRHMTLKDYLITVSEAGLGWTATRDFLLQEIGPEATNKALYELARMLAQNGFNDDAVAVYNYFINLDKNAAEAVDYWNKIANIYRFNFPFAEVEAQVRQLRLFFRPDGPWIANNSGNAAAREKADDLIVKWDLSLAEFYLEEGLYFNKGEDSFLKAINRGKEILQQGAGKRQEQAWAGILMAYMGLVKLSSQGRLIFVAENVLGPAYPDDYKLPRQVRRMTLEKYEAAYVDALKSYLELPALTGQKPDLKPLAAVDVEADFLYIGALFHYVRGMNEEGLALIDKLLAHSAKSEYAGWAGDMIYQMSARANDWAALQKRVKVLLDAGNIQTTPEIQLKDYLCAGIINEGVALSEKGKVGDAQERLSTATQTCTDNLERAAEAWFKLGEISEKNGFIPQAQEAYKKVLSDYSKSKYRSMAQRNYNKIKNK